MNAKFAMALIGLLNGLLLFAMQRHYAELDEVKSYQLARVEHELVRLQEILLDGRIVVRGDEVLLSLTEGGRSNGFLRVKLVPEAEGYPYSRCWPDGSAVGGWLRLESGISSPANGFLIQFRRARWRVATVAGNQVAEFDTREEAVRFAETH